MGGVQPLIDNGNLGYFIPSVLLLYGELAPQAGISHNYNNRLSQQDTQVFLTAAAGADEKLTAEQVDEVVGFMLEMYQLNGSLNTVNGQ